MLASSGTLLGFHSVLILYVLAEAAAREAASVCHIRFADAGLLLS